MATAPSPWPFIGHDALGQLLLSSLNADTLPAVVLMVGPAHLGKSTASRWLAQHDLCATRQACGTCGPCRQVLAGQHPLVVDIQPDAERLSFEDVRQAMRRWLTAPSSNDRRWLIITDLDRLHESGGNVLLKFLEDVPRQTHVIMTTSRPSSSLATLRSRAAMYRWHLVSSKEIEMWLASTFPAVPPSMRLAIAARAAGRPGLAASMAATGQTDQIDFENFLQTYNDPAAYLQRPAPDNPLGAVMTETLGLREVLMSAFQAQRRLWPESADQAQLLQSRRPISVWLNTLERALSANDLLNRNAQPKLVLNDLLLA